MATAAVAEAMHSTAVDDDEMMAIAMQIDEIYTLKEQGKGKDPVNRPSDTTMAMQSFQTELEMYNCCLNDQKLARSMAQAVHTDGSVIADMMYQDLQSTRDRQMALQLSGSVAGRLPRPRSVQRAPQASANAQRPTVPETAVALLAMDSSINVNQAGSSTAKPSIGGTQADTPMVDLTKD